MIEQLADGHRNLVVSNVSFTGPQVDDDITCSSLDEALQYINATIIRTVVAIGCKSSEDITYDKIQMVEVCEKISLMLSAGVLGYSTHFFIFISD